MPVLDMSGYIRHKKEKLKEKVKAFSDFYGVIPGLAILTDEVDPRCKVYMKSKESMAAEVGIETCTVPIRSYTEMQRFLSVSEVTGIPTIKQMPFNTKSADILYDSVRPNTDVDGVFDYQALSEGNYGLAPATAKGIYEYITDKEGLNLTLRAKNVVIFGRGKLVGYPLAMMMMNAGATVSIVNSKTEYDLKLDLVKYADIIVLATGQRGSLALTEVEGYNDARYIINVGTVFDGYENTGKLTTELLVDRDVAVNSTGEIYWTDRIGAIGPCTVLALLDNVINWYTKKFEEADKCLK